MALAIMVAKKAIGFYAYAFVLWESVFPNDPFWPGFPNKVIEMVSSLSLDLGNVLWFVLGTALLFGDSKLVHSVRMRIPIPFIGIRDEHTKPMVTIEATQNHEKHALNQQEITENLAFLQALWAVSEQLQLNTDLGYSHSVGSILRDVVDQETAHSYLRDDNLISQDFRFIDSAVQALFTRAQAFHSEAKSLSASSVSQDDVGRVCGRVRDLVSDYRMLVKEAATFLDGLRNRGLQPFWATAPWTERIHQHLTNDYDRLMSRVSALRIHLPTNALGNAIPADSQLGTLGGQALFP